MDATHLSFDKSEDPEVNRNTYSGKREYRHCVLFNLITCPLGSIVAVTPGPNISCTPRGGDGTSFGVQVTISRLQNLTGFVTLLAGSPELGTCLVVDRGYVVIPHNVNIGDNPTFLQFCEENDVLPLFRSNVGEQCFRYFLTSRGLAVPSSGLDECLNCTKDYILGMMLPETYWLLFRVIMTPP